MKISIFSKHHDDVFQIEEAVRIEAFKRGIVIDDDNPDVIIYIGGDGTFLDAIQKNIDRLDDVIFLGVNAGSLGYFYEFGLDDIEDMFAYLDSGSLKMRRMNLMKCEAGNTREQFEFYALNEVRLINSFSTLKCDVFINGELLENYIGNELVISTSYGSSGLNRSLGGAIVHPDISCFQITPIAPINNKIYSTIVNPIILYNNVEIYIKNKTKGAMIGFDCFSIEEPISFLKVTRSDLYASVFFRADRTFIDKLKESFIK